MKKLIINSIILLALAQVAIAQKPVPASAQDRKIALTGGIAHIGTGQVIQNSVIGFDKGKLTIVADAANKPDLTGYEIIDVSGKQLYPGFILTNTSLGLQEVSAVSAMDDYNEHGELNPNVRSISTFNTDSELIPTMRFNGILLAESTPSGGLISGTSSVMEMEGWNWEDAAHSVDVAIHLNWPAKAKRDFDFTTFTFTDSENKEYAKKVGELDMFFTDAYSYEKSASKVFNLKMESMQGLFEGKKTLMLHAESPKEIIEAVRFGQKHNVVRMVIISASGAYPVAGFLKENKIPVILTAVHELPQRPDDDVDMPYKLPFLLTSAGLSVSLSHSDMLARARSLAFYAGTAAAYGMDKEEALKTITSNPAKALGIDGRVGTLEVGKDATLFVSQGDALDMRTNILLLAFITGKSVTLPGNQQELYERYSRKYGHK